MHEITFELGYRCGPFNLQVGQPVVTVTIEVTSQLKRRIHQILDANRAFGRDKVKITPEQPVSIHQRLPEPVGIRTVDLVVRHDGELGIHAVDQHWRVLRERERVAPVTQVPTEPLVEG